MFKSKRTISATAAIGLVVVGLVGVVAHNWLTDQTPVREETRPLVVVGMDGSKSTPDGKLRTAVKEGTDHLKGPGHTDAPVMLQVSLS
jgi:hypothetical protein